MAEFEKDPAFVERRRQRDEERRRSEEADARGEAPVVEELRKAGYPQAEERNIASRMPVKRLAQIAALIAALAASGGCTTIGVHTAAREVIDFGPRQTLEVCVLKDPDVTSQSADELIAAVNKEFEPYAIVVTVPWVRDWERPAFTVYGIIEDLLNHELEAPCDRLIGLVDRHVGDLLWGLLMPEVLGAVDGVTRTRGYVVATFGSLNQLFAEPISATVHEFYHLLGCPHGVSKTKCYHKLAEMKASRQPESDFFPGMTKEGKYLVTREETNEAIRKFLAEQQAKRKGKAPQDTSQTAEASAEPAG